jgi:hypothetical protein
MKSVANTVSIIAKAVTIILALGVAAISGFGFIFAMSMTDGSAIIVVAGIFGIPVAAAIGFIALVFSSSSGAVRSGVEWTASFVFSIYGIAAFYFAGGPVKAYLPVLMMGTLVAYWVMRSLRTPSGEQLMDVNRP